MTLPQKFGKDTIKTKKITAICSKSIIKTPSISIIYIEKANASLAKSKKRTLLSILQK